MNIYRQKIEELRQEYQSTLEAQQAEIEALRPDAERYRWLKVERRPAAELDAAFNTYGIPVDEFIDAARARERRP